MANRKPIANNAGTLQEIATNGTDTTDTGVTLYREQAADPAFVANAGQTYTKDDGAGNTELFYEDEAGNVEQLTGNAGAGQQLSIPMTTTGITSGFFVYQDPATNEKALHTSATAIATARAVGAFEGVVGKVTIAGVIQNARLIAGAGVTRGQPVWLALAADDGATGAGKLRETAPSGAGQVVSEVGIALETIAGGATGKVLLQIKSPIILV